MKAFIVHLNSPKLIFNRRLNFGRDIGTNDHIMTTTQPSLTSITFAAIDGVATITLNRPDKLNSFTRHMHSELRTAMDLVENDPAIRCLVFAGAGRGFCAGQDLADLSFDPANRTDLAQLIGDNFNPLISRIRALPKPTIAKIHGIAAGAGANLALACDLVIASKTASFLQAFVNIGLAPDSGGTLFLPEKIGTARAIGLAMLGQKLGAEQAAQWGLIWQCVEANALDSTVDSLSAKLAQMPTRALAAIKKTIYAAGTQTLTEQLTMERDLQGELGASFDYNEGVAAFLAKRSPKFEGR
jgi:2-(1,2-epoxy-1,2-dihydrophenyl)acetyl-CoA isomerase